MATTDQLATPEPQSLRRKPLYLRALTSTPGAVALYLLILGVIVYGSYTGAQNMGYNWQWYQIPKYIYTFTEDGFQWGELSHGLVATIYLSLVSFLLALALGLVVALLRLSNLLVGTAGRDRVSGIHPQHPAAGPALHGLLCAGSGFRA